MSENCIGGKCSSANYISIFVKVFKNPPSLNTYELPLKKRKQIHVRATWGKSNLCFVMVSVVAGYCLSDVFPTPEWQACLDISFTVELLMTFHLIWFVCFLLEILDLSHFGRLFIGYLFEDAVAFHLHQSKRKYMNFHLSQQKPVVWFILRTTSMLSFFKACIWKIHLHGLVYR